jgi:hypothetical protein
VGQNEDSSALTSRKERTEEEAPWQPVANPDVTNHSETESINWFLNNEVVYVVKDRTFRRGTMEDLQDVVIQWMGLLGPTTYHCFAPENEETVAKACRAIPYGLIVEYMPIIVKEYPPEWPGET